MKRPTPGDPLVLDEFPETGTDLIPDKVFSQQ